MADEAARRVWLSRVLGVEIAEGPQGPGGVAEVQAETQDAGAIWRDAKEAADVKITQLAGLMRKTGDVDLIQIADLGLFGIVSGGGANVTLNKALLDYRAASGERRTKAAAALRKAVEAYRSALSGSEGVRLIDANPFGVQVSLAATLGGALDRIERSLG